MDDIDKFEFGNALQETRGLKADLQAVLIGLKDEHIAAIAKEVEAIRFVGDTDEDPPLSVAFVGQYNAGKSTILHVLTGRDDIVIDSDVCTRGVGAYDWNGVQLLDTPGIHAGYAEHDAATYAAIDRADLLVFVITSELFDDTIGRHFRELAFTRQHAREMILVVNKMAQDAGTPDAKRADIDKVTAPLCASDFRAVFIDARSWLEAQETTDARDRDELLEFANIGDLVDALNAFVQERKLIGRLTAPLFTMRSLAEQGCALLSTDSPEERAALELLHRKRGLFLSSRARLRNAMTSVVSNAVSDITRLGDEVAESIEPGKAEQQVEALHADAQCRASGRCASLAAEVRGCVEAEFVELRRQLASLHVGVLARELRGLVQGGEHTGARDPAKGLEIPEWSARPVGADNGEWPEKAKKIGDVASSIGSWAARWATGPAANVAIWSASAARGSQAHQAVYNVGKFFGVKFRPWSAVKVARAIGNAGRVIAAVGSVLVIVAQIAEDRANDRYRRGLREARDGVRAAYRESALSVRAEVWGQFEAFLSDFYDSELQAIDDVAHDLVGKRSHRSRAADAFAEIAKRASRLIDRVQANVEVGVEADPSGGSDVDH